MDEKDPSILELTPEQKIIYKAQILLMNVSIGLCIINSKAKIAQEDRASMLKKIEETVDLVINGLYTIQPMSKEEIDRVHHKLHMLVSRGPDKPMH